MRIVCVFALALMLIATPALAEITIDLDTATLEELTDVRNLIDAEIRAREAANAETFLSGSYEVGTDIAAGLYVVYPDESTRVSSVSVLSLTNDEEQMVVFEAVRGQMVVEIREGQQIDLTNACAVPLVNSLPVNLSDGEVCNGGYLVGTHLPAGQYTLTPVKDALLPSYSILTGPSGTLSSILAFAVIHETVEITLEDGNYIQLTNCVLMASE